MPDTSSCVDDDALFALARGQVGGAELAGIETHLQDCADCRAVLAEAARSLNTSAVELAEASPTRIARYEVIALIGAGASGVVYRGYDPQLKRAVALKLLRAEPAGGVPAPAERSLREAQAMARLSDQHVVAVYDVGIHQGMVFLVMEFVDGQTLRQWLQQERRSPSEISRVFAEAGRGLAAAHHKGLVHRDFKPENVLVGRDGRARVTDFGLARESEGWLSRQHDDDQASTELYAPTRGLIGTPAYMAPELFEGATASARSDQFAFCVTLFVASFEQHPFKAGEGIALSELITLVRAGALRKPPLSERGSQRLFEVLKRGLAARPEQRFEDMPQLLAALERSRRRGARGWLLAVLLAVGLAAWLLLARGGDRAKPASVEVSEPATPAAGQAGAGPAPSREEKIETVPAASGPAAASAPARPVQRKRAPAKPGEVRYKDWLKEPF